MPITKTCRNCGTEFKVPPSRAKTAYTCSKTCKYALHPKTRSVEVKCHQCGKITLTPASRAKRGNGKFCSKACRFEHMKSDPALSARMKGDKNPHWKGGVIVHRDGYLYRRSADHPNQSNGYVFEHRLVIEDEMRQKAPDHPFMVNGYLAKELSVHHRDHDRLNNSPENLMAMTPEAHAGWHQSGRIPKPWECWPNVHPGA